MTVIRTESITSAFKAKELLQSRGFFAEVFKESGVNGCTYNVRTSAARQTAEALINSRGRSDSNDKL